MEIHWPEAWQTRFIPSSRVPRTTSKVEIQFSIKKIIEILKA
jgi:hypothetical protein